MVVAYFALREGVVHLDGFISKLKLVGLVDAAAAKDPALQAVLQEALELARLRATQDPVEQLALTLREVKSAEQLAEIETLAQQLGDSGEFAAALAKVRAEGVVAKWTAHGGKHVAKTGVPWKQIVESTKNGPAKYKPGTDIEALERHVFTNGTPVTNGKSWKVMEFGEDIGAANGNATRFMRVEESAGVIHGHPISPSEFKKLTK